MVLIFDFNRVPLIFGTPNQRIVVSEEELFRLIKDFSGKTPVYTSHNSYEKFDGDNPYLVRVNKIFIDLDSKLKPENAQLDAIKIGRWCDEHKLPRVVAFSGSKGFHVYIGLKEETYVMGEFLRRATRAIHTWLTKELELRTLDMRCSDPKRLRRVFYTPHVSIDKQSGKPIANGFYCCPLLPEWVEHWDIRQIMEYARRPTLFDYNPAVYEDYWEAELLTLDQFLNRFNIDLDNIPDGIENYGIQLADYKPVSDEFIKKVLPRPCVHTQIVHSINPPHEIRFCAAVALRDLGYDPGWVFKFFQDRNYVDRINTAVCASQINSIFNHRPLYRQYGCSTMYKLGYCVGKVCSKYSDDL